MTAGAQAPGRPDYAGGNLRGSLFMCLSMAGFILNDTATKWIADELTLFQIIFIRGVFASVLIGTLAACKNSLIFLPSRRDRKILALRLVGEIGATYCFLNALFNMPIANATAILQSLPLAVTLAAALFLGERVGWRRYMAICAGFAGVLVIIRPGTEGFTSYSLWAVAAVGLITLRDLSTRMLSPDVPSLFVTFLAAVGVMILGAVFAPFTEWKPVDGEHLAFLGFAAALVFVGYLFGVMAMRHGEISFVSPFRYTILIWAVILGLVVFGDVPDTWTLSGSAIVVGMGVYTFYRERVRSRQSAQGTVSKQPE